MADNEIKNEAPAKSRFARGFSAFIDILILGILFLFTSIPVFTMGVSAAAIYYAIHKSVFQGRGYAWKEYFSAFKDNFKNGSIAGLIVLALFGILGGIFYAVTDFSSGKIISGNFVLVIFAAFVLMWALVMFPFMARFENNLPAIMKSSAIIAVLNFAAPLELFILMVPFGALAYFLPGSILVIPGFYMTLAHQVLEKVFRSYMSKEERELEDARLEGTK